MKKTYCEGCKYFQWDSTGFGEPFRTQCSHTDNIVAKIDKSNYLKEKFDYSYLDTPERINKNNDCKYRRRDRRNAIRWITASALIYTMIAIIIIIFGG